MRRFPLPVFRFSLVLLTPFVVVLASCGYHTAGRASRLPADLHTIAIPAFANTTTTYHIEQVLTQAVVREFGTRTSYRVVPQDPSADAVLRGTVLTASIAPLTYDSQTGRASSAVVEIRMRVSLVDRKGKTLYENTNYLFREQYQISRELSSFFQEESPAVDRLSRDFSRTLVSNILEAY